MKNGWHEWQNDLKYLLLKRKLWKTTNKMQQEINAGIASKIQQSIESDIKNIKQKNQERTNTVNYHYFERRESEYLTELQTKCEVL